MSIVRGCGFRKPCATRADALPRCGSPSLQVLPRAGTATSCASAFKTPLVRPVPPVPGFAALLLRMIPNDSGLLSSANASAGRPNKAAGVTIRSQAESVHPSCAVYRRKFAYYFTYKIGRLAPPWSELEFVRFPGRSRGGPRARAS